MSVIYSFISAVLCLVPGWCLAARWNLRPRKGFAAVFWAVFICYYLSLVLSIFWRPFNFPLLAFADDWSTALIIAQMFVYPLLVAVEATVLHALYRLMARGKAPQEGERGFRNREFFALALFACGAANFIFPFGAYLLERV